MWVASVTRIFILILMTESTEAIFCERALLFTY